MANGDLIKLGTFYNNNIKWARPTNPISGGNITTWSTGQTIEIRDTDSDDAYKLQWREVNDGGKKYLVSDRNLLTHASWNDLNAQGLIFGKIIIIDGKHYKLRSLAGGSNYRTGTDAYSGGSPSNNEWDRWIVNEAGLSGLPVPTATDLDNTKNTTDLNGTHNQFWNWMDIHSWVQETYTGNGQARIVRGTQSARYLVAEAVGSRNVYIGFRPVLEEVTLPPGTVTPNNYSTSGNGGRKLVRLSNGWEVAGVKDIPNKAIYFYVDKKDGKGFTPLTFTRGNGGDITGDFSIVNKNNTVYVFVNRGVFLYKLQFDATNVTNVEQEIFQVVEGNSQSTVGNVTLAINQAGTKIMGAASTKNSAYSNSFNIRYYEAPINGDGTVGAWTVEQWTNWNTAGMNAQNPTITATENKPVVMFDWANSATLRNVYAMSSSGMANTPVNNFLKPYSTIYSGGTYAQFSPSAVTDKDGVIHVAWHGRGPTNNDNIYYSKSMDGGVTWSVMQRVTDSIENYVHPSITTDKYNNLYIICSSSGFATKGLTKIKNISGTWTIQEQLYAGTYTNPSTLYDPTFTGTFGETPPTIYQDTQAGMVKYIGTYTTNQAPTVTLNTTNNRTLYENDTFTIDGSALDTDANQSVTVYYQIDSLPRRVLTTGLSGVTIPFNKVLTFKAGKLLDGGTDLTGVLNEGSAHTLKVWAEDNQNGIGMVSQASFNVVGNRAPTLTINPMDSKVGLIDNDSVEITGTTVDPEGQEVRVRFNVNGGSYTEVHNGQPGDFTINIKLDKFAVGENTVQIQVLDSYDFVTSKTLRINKKDNTTKLKKSVARYKLTLPSGGVSGLIAWVEADIGDLTVDMAASMRLTGEQELFEEMENSNTAPIDQEVEEKEFRTSTTATAKDSVLVKLSLNRLDNTSTKTVKQVTGAMQN